MILNNAPSMIFDLSALPRYCGGKPEVEKIGWFKDHIYWHKEAVIDAENISFTLERDPGKEQILFNGEHQTFTTDNNAAVILSCTPYGSRITTLATQRRNELLFRYPAGKEIMPEYPFERKLFPWTKHFYRLVGELEYLLDNLHIPGTADQIDLLAMAMTAEAMASSANNTPAQAENTLQLKVLHIHNRIASNPAVSGNIPQIAAEYGMSRAVFYREWQKQFQITPYDFVIQSRLQNAKWLLRHTSYAVKEVAAAVGFRSSPVFCDTFKKHTGFTPLAFRRKQDG